MKRLIRQSETTSGPRRAVTTPQVSENKTGFTIVELIVVIAVIGVMASIITASVGSYLVKSKDAKIKAEISEIFKDASTYYIEQGTYSEYEIPSGFVSSCAGSNYTLATNSSNAFVVYAKLCSTDTYWCADSTGGIREIDSPPDTGAGVYACVSGSGGGGDGGCGGGEECLPGYICYDNTTCIQCNTSSDPLCNDGEDCRRPDCVCLGVGETCTDECGSYTCTHPFACGSTFTDVRDCKSYATVQIGSQCWMAENINIGTMTAGANEQGTSCDTIQKYCYSNNEGNCDTYGGLYQ